MKFLIYILTGQKSYEDLCTTILLGGGWNTPKPKNFRIRYFELVREILYKLIRGADSINRSLAILVYPKFIVSGQLHIDKLFTHSLAKKMNTEVKDYLGAGVEGQVYSLANGKVIKISKSESEINQWDLLVNSCDGDLDKLNAKYPFLVKLHDYGEIRCRLVKEKRYFFVMEHLDTSNYIKIRNALEIEPNGKTSLNQLCRNVLKSREKEDIEDLIHYKGELKALEEHMIDDEAFNEAELFGLAIAVIDLTLEALDCDKLKSSDLHDENVGFRGNKLIWFDIGYSEVLDSKMNLKLTKSIVV